MKKGIHPDYVESRVTCSCGESFVTRATKPDLHIELCSKCHPFYTGTQKLVDSGGRVQRFSDKFGNAAAAVMEREAADREARRKAAEEAAIVAREARAARDGEKSDRTARHEVAAAVESGEATAELVEEPVAEDIEETAAATEAETTEAETTEAAE